VSRPTRLRAAFEGGCSRDRKIMTSPALPKILIVDDEEPILETMTFTFMDAYEVLTSTEPERALEMLEEFGPIAVVLTDQRMPRMTGVEFLKLVYERHPETTRIMLTGFADSEATIQAINDGHVYAYVNKPWEPLELKQMVKRAVELHQLTMENRRLVENLSRVNIFLEAVMDRLEMGAIALDADEVVQAANRTARRYLELGGDPRGRNIGEILKERGFESVCDAVSRVSDEEGGSFEDLDVDSAGARHRIRVSAQALEGAEGRRLGRVIFFKEISHEPLRRCFEEEVAALAHNDGELRERLGAALKSLADLGSRIGTSGITSTGMAELGERVSRTRTAIQSWLEVDDILSRESYPDAQLLRERMRIANSRWPLPDVLPERVVELSRRVEAYYESGENPKQRVL